MKLSGIAGAPGIALGRIVRLEREEFVIRDTQVVESEIEREIARYQAALEASHAGASAADVPAAQAARTPGL